MSYVPVFKSGIGSAPPWCEMRFFEIVEIPQGTFHVFPRISENEMLFVVQGSGQAHTTISVDRIHAGAILDFPDRCDAVKMICEKDILAVRISGCWGTEIGSSGVFTLGSSSSPGNAGDPEPYPRNTVFDNHYHDFNEYWIISGGRGEVVTECTRFSVGGGDCVATEMGHHHDFPLVHETIKGVWFEGTLRGMKRLGHLWEHKHGPASPR